MSKEHFNEHYFDVKLLLMPQGLTNAQAQENLKNYGFNELIDSSRSSSLKILFRQVKSNFVIYMLVLAVVISLFVGKEETAYAVGAVILLVISVGFIQEYKAEEAVAGLKKMLMPISIVYRDGKKQEISSKERVPDDVLVLENGEKVPADCVVFEDFSLRVNESALTGESREITKSVSGGDKELYMGTYIVNGRCLARVTHTGMNTKFGKIAHLISTAEKELPLQRKVNNIAKYMVTVAIITSIATGLLMATRAPNLGSTTITEILILVVALSVSAFPEGFPVVLVTTLALGAKRMSAKNAIVNRMSIIETLGEVTIICSDKTGTLTRGEMTVKHIFTGSNLYDVSGSGYVAHGKVTEEDSPVDLHTHPELQAMIEAGIFCNDAEIERTGDDHEYKALGSPTEAALLILGAKLNIFSESYKAARISEKPFNSEKKMMSVLYEKDNDYFVYAKGAPEVLINNCSKILHRNEAIELTLAEKEKLLAMQKEMASNAFRTLCIAYKKIREKDTDYTDDKLIFLGLVAMEDPPREEARESIRIAEKAGIRVIMATGDNKDTAVSIAKQLGLAQTVIDGTALDQLTDQELAVTIKETSIYARVRPEHKIRLVRILKDLGEIVAMTGDGVNDAPALKEAHVGIAMGKNGTDVSRSASDLILKDDNFKTIVSAIAEGRTVYSNIRKFVTYQLSCNLSELVILFVGVVVAPVLGWQTPLLLSLQILFMNLVTDNMPALTLGVNPTSSDIMDDQPRSNETILNKRILTLLLTSSIIMATTTLVSYFVAFNIFSYTTDQSRTVALVTLIFIQIIMAFNYRSFRKLTLTRSPFINKYLVVASVGSITATILIIYTPLSKIFETAQFGIHGWLLALTLGFIVLIINDAIKHMNIKSASYISATK